MWSNRVQQRLAQCNVVLGSSSPRRKEILSTNLGIAAFEVVCSTFEENLPKSGPHEQYVSSTAQHKIASIVEQLSHERHLLIVADTIVSCGERILEKPQTADAQLDMLRHYKQHSTLRVITAVHVCIAEGGAVVRTASGSETTALVFDLLLSQEELQHYVATGEGLHVAGGFKYQEQGSLLFRGIDGDYFNVVGLPVGATSRLIAQVLQP